MYLFTEKAAARSINPTSTEVKIREGGGVGTTPLFQNKRTVLPAETPGTNRAASLKGFSDAANFFAKNR